MGSQRVNTTAGLSLSIAAHTGENTEKKQREKKTNKHTGPKSKPKKQISPDQRELCVPHEG